MARPYVELKGKKYYAKAERSLNDMLRVMRIGKKIQGLADKEKENEEYIPLDEFEELLYFIVEMYEEKFTVEELADGLPYGQKGLEKAMEIIQDLSKDEADEDVNLTK